MTLSEAIMEWPALRDRPRPVLIRANPMPAKGTSKIKTTHSANAVGWRDDAGKGVTLFPQEGFGECGRLRPVPGFRRRGQPARSRRGPPAKAKWPTPSAPAPIPRITAKILPASCGESQPEL